MAVTIQQLGFGKKVTSGATRWKIMASSADASGAELIVKAPGAGKGLFIEKINVAIGASITANIGQGESSGACAKVLIGPLGGAAMFTAFDFGDEPLKLDTNQPLTLDASGAGVVCVVVQGYTADASETATPSQSISASPSTSVSSSPSSSASA